MVQVHWSGIMLFVTFAVKNTLVQPTDVSWERFHREIVLNFTENTLFTPIFLCMFSEWKITLCIHRFE